MSDFNILLDAFPEAALIVRQGVIAASNPLARHYLPQLEAGSPLPEAMCLPADAPGSMGTFSNGLSRYELSCRDMGGEGTLVLFRPAPQTALTDTQLDGAIGQLRQLLNDMVVSLGLDPDRELPAALPKSCYRMFRLLDNLDFMRSAQGGSGVRFQPITMDLAGLCGQLVDKAAPLLADRGVKLTFTTDLPSLLIPGDPALLQRLLLELISNAARANGTVDLRLSRRGGRAMLTLSDSGAAPTPRQLAAMVQQDADQNIPLPGSGAGLGLSIVRHIAALHGGSMLVEWGKNCPTVFLSLPTGPLDPRASVRTPGIQTDGGLDPLLVGLADVLPAQLFSMEGLD